VADSLSDYSKSRGGVSASGSFAFAIFVHGCPVEKPVLAARVSAGLRQPFPWFDVRDI
jgi:hypothetical protein